jgi:hypothetical protein
MPQKKTTPTHHFDDLHVDLDDLQVTRTQARRPAEPVPPEMVAARHLMTSIESRMQALMSVARERWVPAQRVEETDETDRPVLGDDQYDHFIATVELMSQTAMFRDIGVFMGVPAAVLDDVIREELQPPKVIPKKSRGHFKIAKKGS